ncbi:SPOR domain-containing protein [Thiofilum flexile]|uniref:SPOR domain-containing protein n=1 Tax=Thiofilum flexile TaxID=125627 RepID=UPI000369E0D0|nr:SPOR domain-containing protein [Thiofilum flexile]
MNYALVLLIVLNLSVLAWNVLLAPAHNRPEIPLTLPNIPELVRVDKVPGEAVYSSQLAPSQSSCFTIGPYASQQAALLVQEKINNYGLAVKMRAIRSMETLNFLVYIPAFASATEAQKVIEDMKRFKVTDAVIINEGAYQNAISLGLFTNLTLAKRQTEYVRYLGYDARFTEQKAAREVFWLDYDEPLGSNTPVPAWSKAIDASTNVQKIPRACQS